jgi:hypothetical protein
MGETHFRSDIRERGAARTASFSTFQGSTINVTNASINTATINTASIENLTVSASAIVGGATNYAKIDNNYGIYLGGDASVWDDLRFPPGRVVVNPANSKPDYIGLIDNINMLGFDKSASEWVTGIAQMPHGYKEGSYVEPHVHWVTTSAASTASHVCWKIDYTWVNPDTGNIFYNASVQSLTATSPAAGAASTLVYCSLGTANGTGKEVSSIIAFRLIRNVSHAEDDIDSDVGMLEFDIHYQIDAMGSRQISAK